MVKGNTQKEASYVLYPDMPKKENF